MSSSDVLIVGCGPVGAVLAALLGKRGLTVTVVERELDVFPLPRAAHIDHMGLRALQEIGCLDQLLPGMRPNKGLDFVTANGELLVRIPGDQRSISGLPASMYFHQPGFDRAIRDTAAALASVTIHTGTEFRSLSQDADGVDVVVTEPGGRERVLRASWVVGCDGARSPVRAALGLEVEDMGFSEPWLVLDLVLEPSAPTLSEGAVHTCDPSRPVMAIPMPGRRYRFEVMLLPGEDPEVMIDLDVVESILSRWLPPGSAQIERRAVYEFQGLVASDWRSGRVLIAGDAAHQMPPMLGQGMCSGIRDATNLAWKLDDVIRGRASDALLDTYTVERRPHVRGIVQAAVDFGRLVCTLDPKEAAARDERMLHDTAPPTERWPFRLPLLEPGPFVLEGGGNLFIQPEVAEGEERLDDMVGGRFLVLARTSSGFGTSARWWQEEAGALVTTIDDLPDPSGAVRRWLDRKGVACVIVRPDRYVLAATDDLDKVTEAVRPLFSVPARTTQP
jgi:3-(3-hydroxy-phenyl)propionate hydroxylase